MTRAGAVAALALLLTAAPAAAERPAEPLPQQAVSANLRVHYTTAPDSPHRITDEHAQSVLVHGEAALATVVAEWGHEILRDGTLGGDERIDVYLADILPTGKGGRTQPDQPITRTSGFVTMTPRTSVARTIAHELFHLAQYALERTESTWLKEASAEWAEHRITGDYANGLRIYRPEFALDCDDPACGGGYQSWRFFEYLTERHGIAIVKRIFEHARDLGAGDDSLAAIDTALAERGTGLAAAFADFASANMTGAYARAEVAAWRAGPDLSLTAPAPGAASTTSVAVDRLATRYLAIEAPRSTPCRTTTIALQVTAQPGRATRPAYRPAGSGGAIALSTGVGTVGWSTCDGLSLLLAVPNTSAASGVASYRVLLRLPPPPTTEAPRAPSPEPALTTRVRLATGQRMSSVLRHGLRLRLNASRPANARVSVTVLAGRRTRARHALRRTVTRHVRLAGPRTVRFRLRPSQRPRRAPKRLHLAVRARITAPSAAAHVHRSTVTVTSRAARSKP